MRNLYLWNPTNDAVILLKHMRFSVNEKPRKIGSCTVFRPRKKATRVPDFASRAPADSSRRPHPLVAGDWDDYWIISGTTQCSMLSLYNDIRMSYIYIYIYQSSIIKELLYMNIIQCDCTFSLPFVGALMISGLKECSKRVLHCGATSPGTKKCGWFLWRYPKMDGL